ncbi:hypothetical protein F2P81_015082 [Scophthalmus maximus]|uniref:Uncharacterized protein n=1 Tax=Scophthalmus maximus TaxID=52904 RepID=A0A6A4SR48_SCOMX|nr:hypothetical protein F2P81_015082 [Scophthalmus maximus]
MRGGEARTGGNQRSPELPMIRNGEALKIPPPPFCVWVFVQIRNGEALKIPPPPYCVWVEGQVSLLLLPNTPFYHSTEHKQQLVYLSDCSTGSSLSRAFSMAFGSHAVHSSKEMTCKVWSTAHFKSVRCEKEEKNRNVSYHIET